MEENTPSTSERNDGSKKKNGKRKKGQEWYDKKLGSMRKKLGHTKQKTYSVARTNPETGQKATKGNYKPRIRNRRKSSSTKSKYVNSTAHDYLSFLDYQVGQDQTNTQELEFSFDKVLEEMLATSDDTARPKKTDWQNRMSTLDENWHAIRHLIAQYQLELLAAPNSAVSCGNCQAIHPTSPCQQASLRCLECGIFLCRRCDIALHQCKNHFHKREMWAEGFFEPLFSGSTVDFDHTTGKHVLHSFDQFFPVKRPQECPKCSASDEEDFAVQPTSTMYIVVTLKGRYALKKQQVLCKQCGCIDSNNEVFGILANGFWPGNPKRITHLFEIQLLRWIDLLLKNMPGTSISSVAKALQELSVEDKPINKTCLSRVLIEYRYSEREGRLLAGFDAMKCPPCSVLQHSAHVDGNFKVYRYSKVPKGANKSYYTGTFIMDDKDVTHHKTTVYDGKKGYDEEGNRCGSSYWKAAKSSGSSRHKLSETGLEVAGCRHSLAQAAVNMFTGEQYAYPHFLHSQILLPHGIKYLWQDVICKYWPWATRLGQQKPQFLEAVERVTPALSVMHAKAHAWDCQVLWGGRNVEGAGAGAGEDMELFFSYLSRCGSTTKNMGKATREDTLTDHVLFWNSRKVTSMASQLCRRYSTTWKVSSQTKVQLQKIAENIPGGCSTEVLAEWAKQIKETAQSSHIKTTSSELGQLFILSQQIKEAAPLDQYSEVTSQSLSTLTDTLGLYTEVCKLRDSIAGKKLDFQDLSSKLANQHNVQEEVLLKMGKEAAIEEASASLQDQIELACQAVKLRKTAISKLAVTCKQRTRLRKKNEKEKQRIGEMIDKYNTIISLALSTKKPEEATLEEVLKENFPWLLQGERHQHVPLATKKAAVDLQMLVDRHEEEKGILKTEMCNHIVFYKRVKAQLLSDIDMLPLEDSESSIAWFEIPDNQVANWRYKTHHLTQAALQGIRCVKLAGIKRADAEIARAITLFKKTLDGNISPEAWADDDDDFPNSDDSEPECDSDTEI